MGRGVVVLGIVTGLLAGVAGRAGAQSLGTFRWQLQPYCNLVTVTITQNGGLYRLEGTDDQCGAGRDQAAIVGMAFPNPDGTIGFGLTIVTAPGGVPVHVDAEITVAALSGTWRDSAGGTGTFAFAPGGPTTGSPRPPATLIPPSLTLAADGGIVARPNGPGLIPASGPGTRLMWFPDRAAFRAGSALGIEWDEESVGRHSVAFGFATRAQGTASFAAGNGALAFGVGSIAMGINAVAESDGSVALGRSARARAPGSFAAGEGADAVAGGSTALGASTKALGFASTALGEFTNAAGRWSLAGGTASRADGNTALAFGSSASAAGANSVALGSRAATTTAAAGSFVFADASGSTPFTSFAPNQFVVRAAGGLGVYTNGAATTGAEMAPGGGAWAALSDASMKENFRDVDGEDLLAKLSRVPIREWNYTSQDAGIRHLGPTAQDFRAAFGLGEYERRITSTDADGVALAAVKALDARTREMREKAAQRDEAAAHREADFARREQELLRRIDALERALAAVVGGAR
jgi:Chaperone of endosialidase/Head domain of trimeric autotransporter adhesin